MYFNRFSNRLLPILLLGISCAQSAGDATLAPQGIQTDCSQSSDCTVGLECHPEWNVCTLSDASEQSVGVVITPMAETGLATGHLSDVLVSPKSGHDLTMPSTVRIAGRVRVTNNPIQPSIPSILVAVADSAVIPGLRLRTQTSATDEGYALDLVAGVNYTVTVTVNDLDRPTHRFALQSPISRNNWDIELPPLGDYPVLTGRVFQATNSGIQPVKGVRVTAMRVDDYHQCTTAETDKLGSYTLRCPFESGAYTVHVGPAEDGPVMPSFQVLWNGADRIEVDADQTLEDIVIPESVSEQIVTLQTVDPSGNPIAGIPITITSALPDNGQWTNAVFMRTGSTQSDGLWTGSILQGLHHVVAKPHTSSQWAYRTAKDWVLETEETNTMTLSSKVLFSGTVRAHDGTPEPYARVVTRRQWMQDHTGLKTELEYATETDETGQFTLPVDQGAHHVSVVPGTGRALPRWYGDAPTTVGSAGATLSIQLAPPAVLSGTITSENGTLLQEAAIAIYRLSDADALLIGRGVTQEDGRYHVVLPEKPEEDDTP